MISSYATLAVKAKQPCEYFITCRVYCSACYNACMEMSRCGPIPALYVFEPADNNNNIAFGTGTSPYL